MSVIKLHLLADKIGEKRIQMQYRKDKCVYDKENNLPLTPGVHDTMVCFFRKEKA